MDPLHVAHLMLVCLWGGVVLAESVVEFSARGDEGQRVAARLHYLMDMFIELPLLVAVLATGGILMSRVGALGTLHWVKIAAGLLAIGINFYCMALVVQRHHHAQDTEALTRLGHKVRGAWLGIPFGLMALVMGLGYFRR